MRSPQRIPHQHRIGFCRREVLQVGFSAALGLTLEELQSPRPALASSAGAGFGKAKHVLVIWLPGGPSQMQLWDVKPDSPTQAKGTALPIKTSASGVDIGHVLPQTAKQMHHVALIRSLTLGAEDDNHEIGHQKMLAGLRKRIPGAGIHDSRRDWPSLGSVISALKPVSSGLPCSLHLPIRMTNAGMPFSGESAGMLGGKYDPWLLSGDPNNPSFRVPDLMPMAGMTVDRISQRRQLLAEVDHYRRDLERDPVIGKLDAVNQRAFEITTSSRTRDAFDLSKEPDALRDRYGRHLYGQTLLLSRRLLQAGVRFVQANMGPMNSWDWHNDEDRPLKSQVPPWDQAFSVLLEDMESRGLLQETLILAMSEMGRNPILGRSVTGAAVNAANPGGRNHWQNCWSMALAGGGIRGGTVVGQSDEVAGFPDGEAFYPNDVAATVYHALGVDPRAEIIDMEGRPLVINDGTPITRLF
ncbi:MAG: hypothetical protein K0Q72_4680 [Armatimonadetes bacterium]|nr:hypothetical protein [Armatimonadota bacterium]